jgi:hypothetical protein
MRYRKHQGQALIFVQPKDNDLSLEEFARHVFKDLAISKWQGFCGSQAPNSDGFAGDAVNIEVVIGREDEDSEYSFGVSLQPKIAFGDTDYLVEHARNIAKHWSHLGWRCFVPREGLYDITNFEDGYVYAA